MKKVRAIIEKFYGIDLSLPSRKRTHVYPRYIYFYICYHNLNMTYYKIAQSVNKNHATVLYGVRELPYIMKYDKKVSQDFQFIKILCKQNHVKMSVDLSTLVKKYNDLLLKFDKLESAYSDLKEKMN
jgi:hypothetical protein